MHKSYKCGEFEVRRYFKSPFTIFLAVVVVILLVIMIFSIASGHKLTPAENVSSTILSPLQTAATAVRNWVVGIFDRQNIEDLMAENAALKDELEKALLDAEEISALRQENAELRAFYELYEQNPDYELVYASVVAFDINNLNSNVTINKGSAAGIKRNDVVVSPDGLVGVVFEVGINYAKVATVLGSNSSVGGTVIRTRETGIVVGDYSLRSKGQCKLTMLRDISAVSVGDTVKTSGLGEIFPEGIIIGKVVSVEENEDFSATAVIQTSAKLSSLKGIMVMTQNDGGNITVE